MKTKNGKITQITTKVTMTDKDRSTDSTLLKSPTDWIIETNSTTDSSETEATSTTLAGICCSLRDGRESPTSPQISQMQLVW